MDLVDFKVRTTYLSPASFYSWKRVGATLAGVLCFWMACSLQAALPDPSDLFLKAYQEFQNAERLEQQNLPDKALVKYRYTADLLSQIQKTNEEWQPLVVSYRLRKTQENIARLEIVHPSYFNASAAPQGVNSRISSSAPSLSITPPSVAGSGSSNDVALVTAPASQLEIKKLRWQLEQAFQENQRLNAAVSKAEAEKQCALIEVDKIKVSLVEAKSQSSDAQNAASVARDQAGRLAQMQEAFKSERTAFQQRLRVLDSDNSVLAEENERLLAKLNGAAAYIQASDKIRENLTRDRSEFYKSASLAKQKLSQIKDNTKLAEELQNANKELLVKNSELTQAVTKNQVALEQATTQTQKAEAEVKKLTQQYADLSAQLAQAQEQNKATVANQQLISELQSQLKSANEALAHSEQTIKDRDIRVADLATQLKVTEGKLAQTDPNEDLQRQHAENELLRGIIIRTMKFETQRNQACGTIGEELKRLKVESSVLSEQLAILQQPVTQLTDEEKRLFKEPVLSVANNADSSSLNASITVFGQKSGAPSAPSNTTANNTFPSPTPSPTSTQATSNESNSALTAEQKSLARLAELAFKEGRFVDCETLYGRIVHKNPDNVFMLANLGAVQSQLGKYAEAETSLNKALKLSPNNSFATTTLGILQLKCAQVAQAIGTLQHSVKIDPQNFSAHNYLGIAYGETGRLDEAEKELKTAIDLNPNYAIAHFNLAVLYSTQKKTNKELARKHYILSTHLGAAPNPDLERLIR